MNLVSVWTLYIYDSDCVCIRNIWFQADFSSWFRLSLYPRHLVPSWFQSMIKIGFVYKKCWSKLDWILFRIEFEFETCFSRFSSWLRLSLYPRHLVLSWFSSWLRSSLYQKHLVLSWFQFMIQIEFISETSGSKLISVLQKIVVHSPNLKTIGE